MSFEEMDVRPETLAALRDMGVTEPTPIQAQATPELLKGRDVIGQAQTGSGKTLAFSIPLVEKCDPELAAVQALVLVPTRELAFQVGSVIESLSKGHRLRCAFLYGGRDVSDQQTLLASGPQVVIGTPGRLLDLLYRGNLRLNELRLIVIDEADEMFDEGFGPDVDQLLDCIIHKSQVALFSATMPGWVQSMVARRLHDPAVVKIEAASRPVDNVEHTVFEVPDSGKLELLMHLLDLDGTAVVFCRTKDGVERLASQLTGRRFDVANLRGNMSQPDRERVMRAFRQGRPRVLVATNVAARGLDVSHIARVINYDLPDSPELLTHRLGRTGRMGRSGEAVTIITPRDRKRWAAMAERLKIPSKTEQWSRPAEKNGASSTVRNSSPPAATVERKPEHRRSERPSANRPVRSDRARTSRELVETTCEGCGAKTQVPFKPTATRPAYCRECRDLVSVAV